MKENKKNSKLVSNLITYGFLFKNLPNHYQLVRKNKFDRIIDGNKSPYECLVNLIEENPKIKDVTAIEQYYKVTYKQLLEAIDKVADYLYYNLKHDKIGENISICSSSSLEGIIAFFAMNKLGLVNARIFNGAKEEKIKENLENFNSKTVFIDNDNVLTLAKIITKTAIENIIVMDKCNIDELKLQIPKLNIITWNEIIAQKNGLHNEYKVNVQPNDMASILYTSGSSGEPKPISIPNKVYVNMVDVVCKTTSVKKCSPEKVVGVVSHEYPYAAINSTIMILLMGKTLLLPEYKNGNIDFNLLMAKKPNRIQAIPNFYKMLEKLVINKAVNARDLELLNYTISGGETYTIPEKIGLLNVLSNANSNPILIDGFGFGELGSATALKFGVNNYFLLMNGIEAKSIDPTTHKDLPIEKEGILCFSAPTITDGYYNNEKATKESFVVDENGKKWFISDTYGLVHGNLKRLIKLGGRLKEYFITSDFKGGFVKVYSGNVEKSILQVEHIKDCIVVPSNNSAIPTPVAYISIKEDCNLSEEDIMKLLIEKTNELEEFAKPTEYIVDAEIKRTQALKKDYEHYKNLRSKDKQLIK